MKSYQVTSSWNLPTLVIKSNEPQVNNNGDIFFPSTPNLYKNELSGALCKASGGNDCEVDGSDLVQIKLESNGAHNPWTDDANNLIYDFIQDTLE